MASLYHILLSRWYCQHVRNPIDREGKVIDYSLYFYLDFSAEDYYFDITLGQCLHIDFNFVFDFLYLPHIAYSVLSLLQVSVGIDNFLRISRWNFYSIYEGKMFSFGSLFLEDISYQFIVPHYSQFICCVTIPLHYSINHSMYRDRTHHPKISRYILTNDYIS